MQADLILTGGHLHTLDPACPFATALAISSGKIVAVGDDRSMRSLAGPATRRIALAGMTVIPGFHDAHQHLWKEGMLLRQVNARPAVAPSIEALVQAFAERAAHLPSGTWLEGRGYDENQLLEHRHPTRADLDRASSHHPIVLGRTCGHIIVVNSIALRLAGIGASTPDPVGGQIDRDDRGEPTGVLRETAMALVRGVQPLPAEAELQQAIIDAGRKCLALGITCIGEPGVDARTVEVYQRLDLEGRLPLRCDIMAMTISPSGVRQPPPAIWQGHLAKVDTCKLFSDGGLSGGTAALRIPYRGRHDCGLPRFPAAQLNEEIARVFNAGLTVAVHAIGDLAIDLVLDAFESCVGGPVRLSGTQRLRIEHCGLPTAGQLARARALGVMLATQPAFLYDLGDSFLHHLPDALIPQCYPFRAMLDAGLTVSFSSDGPVISDINPLLGLRSAVLRRSRTGKPIALEQRIEVAEALSCFTVGSAAVAGLEHRLGRLAPGQEADLVVLSADPLQVPVERLLEIKVVQTFLEGRPVYES